MSGRPRKVSDAGIAEIRDWHRIWKSLPRPRQMRQRFDISESTLKAICRGHLYKTSPRSRA